MHADCAFYTGKTHAVCQDYARIGDRDGLPFVAISDGCSGSIDTDIGSRLLAISASNLLRVKTYALEDRGGISEFPTRVAETARVLVSAIGLDQQCLDSTLIIAAVQSDNGVKKVNCRMYGDGAIIAKKKNGGISLYTGDFTTGVPYYLSYLLNEQRLEAWWNLATAEGGLEKIVRRSVFHHDGNQFVNQNNQTDFFLAEDMSFRISFVKDNYDWVCIASDGIHTFVEKTPEHAFNPIPTPEVVNQMFAFKNYTGLFVQRRIGRYMRDAVKTNIQHDDDFAVAGIYLGD